MISYLLILLKGCVVMKNFTAEELAKYNGQNGSPAYVAAHGKVFDVTNDPYWIKGRKHGIPVGVDWTDILKETMPHSAAFENLPHIGFLEE